MLLSSSIIKLSARKISITFVLLPAKDCKERISITRNRNIQLLFLLKLIDQMHQHGRQLGDEDDGAAKGARDAGQEDGPSADVEAVPETRPGRISQSVRVRLHGTVEQFVLVH